MSPKARIAVGAVLLVALGAGVGAAIVLALRGGEESPRKAGEGAESLARLGPEGAELVSLLEMGKKATFHARYEATSTDPGAEGQELTIALWRKPPRERQDVVIALGGRVARSSGFLTPSGAVGCTQEGEEPWRCQPIQGLTARGPDEFINQIVKQVSGSQVAARGDTVAGMTVRCFVLTLTDAVGEVCLTAEGIPARIRAGPSRIELVEVGTDVQEGVFTPPAAPQ